MALTSGCSLYKALMIFLPLFAKLASPTDARAWRALAISSAEAAGLAAPFLLFFSFLAFFFAFSVSPPVLQEPSS
eukprot:1161479-Pelagomonas_calceolata.AAC.9